MLIDILFLILLSFPICALIASSPLNLGIWILSTALIFSFSLAMLFSSWFALTLFLIYIGGILVIFAYFIAVTPNLQIRLSPIFFLFVTLIVISSIYLKIVSPFSQYSVIYLNKIYSDYLYFSFNFTFLILLVLVLLLIIIAVVKISNRSKGPLRPFKFYVYINSKTPPLNKNCQRRSCRPSCSQ